MSASSVSTGASVKSYDSTQSYDSTRTDSIDTVAVATAGKGNYGDSGALPPASVLAGLQISDYAGDLSPEDVEVLDAALIKLEALFNQLVGGSAKSASTAGTTASSEDTETLTDEELQALRDSLYAGARDTSLLAKLIIEASNQTFQSERLATLAFAEVAKSFLLGQADKMMDAAKKMEDMAIGNAVIGGVSGFVSFAGGVMAARGAGSAVRTQTTSTVTPGATTNTATPAPSSGAATPVASEATAPAPAAAPAATPETTAPAAAPADGGSPQASPPADGGAQAGGASGKTGNASDDVASAGDAARAHSMIMQGLGMVLNAGKEAGSGFWGAEIKVLEAEGSEEAAKAQEINAQMSMEQNIVQALVTTVSSLIQSIKEILEADQQAKEAVTRKG